MYIKLLLIAIENANSGNNITTLKVRVSTVQLLLLQKFNELY